MKLHQHYGLTQVINARGPFTPLGVSRSSAQVASTVAQALGEFFVIDELQDLAQKKMTQWSQAPAGAVTHCVAAGISLSIAATMTGEDPNQVATLPKTAGLPNRVVIPAGHVVNYGHPIVQDITLTGATPILAGTDSHCSLTDLEHELKNTETACLLLVSSRLVRDTRLDLSQAVSLAHQYDVPVIIDAAAQDLRIESVMAYGADLTLISAHKYLASATAGLVLGRKDLVRAFRLQEKGLGRAMKTSKEAIVSVIAALEERLDINLKDWSQKQAEQLDTFLQRVDQIPGLTAQQQEDPTGMPFSRACITVDPTIAGLNASELTRRLQNATPSIWVMAQQVEAGRVIFELVPLREDEIQIIVTRLESIVAESQPLNELNLS